MSEARPTPPPSPPALIYPRLEKTKQKSDKTKNVTLHSEQPEDERWSRVHPKTKQDIKTLQETDASTHETDKRKREEVEEVRGGQRGRDSSLSHTVEQEKRKDDVMSELKMEPRWGKEWSLCSFAFTLFFVFFSTRQVPRKLNGN